MNGMMLHDAGTGTLGAFGGWHAWCSCGWKIQSLIGREIAEYAVFLHINQFDPERAHRYALEKGIRIT